MEHGDGPVNNYDEMIIKMKMVGRLELEKIEAAAEETKIKIEFCSEEMT